MRQNDLLESIGMPDMMSICPVLWQGEGIEAIHDLLKGEDDGTCRPVRCWEIIPDEPDPAGGGDGDGGRQ